MRVIKSESNGVLCYFDSIPYAIEELREILENGLPGDSNTYTICEMTREEYDALPIFDR